MLNVLDFLDESEEAKMKAEQARRSRYDTTVFYSIQASLVVSPAFASVFSRSS